MPGFGPERGRTLLVLPSVGLAGVAGALLFGLASRPVRSVEVYGGPTDGGPEYSLRIHVQEEQNALVRDVAGATLDISWQGPSSESELLATSGDDGWLEVRLRRPTGARGLRLRIVERATGQVLAEGEPSLPRRRWQASAVRRGGRLVGHGQGPVFFDAHVIEATLAYPFVGHIELQPKAEQGHARAAEVEVRLEGAELTTPSHFTLGDAPIVVGVRPEGHLVTLHIDVKSQDGAKSRFESRIPLVPGASYFERSPRGLIVRSALPRPFIWYAFVTEEDRLAGGRLRLTETKSGVSEGLLELEHIPEGPGRYLVLTSSADGRSPSTVGYPLDGQWGTFDALDGRLLDGAAPAARREAKRTGRLRGLLFAHVGLVSLLTLGLFVWRVRAADRELQKNMSQAGARELAPQRFALAAWIAALCLVGGFSLALIWISLSGGVF